MKKKVVAVILMMSMIAGSSLTVCAAPKTMEDGTVFDAEYYAQMYPDVVTELGTNADALYQHYVNFGKAEGRQAEGQPHILGVQGVLGESYDLPTLGGLDFYDGEGEEQILMVIIRTTPMAEYYNVDMERLAPYTTEGYEWRFIHYTTICTFDDTRDWWFTYYGDYDVENSKDWQWAEDDVEYIWKFTVTQDGVDYTECKVVMCDTNQESGAEAIDRTYFLLPKGYLGKVYYTFSGAKLDGDREVQNNDASVTFVF